ncbi:DUF4129 domain-containing protein [Microbacterium sp. zg.Y625]|uniref:DUF4129 domain-containing protein n=1 Tax=Microbacterium jiangjiandongii TaxID=3049071 RepID=UPI00214AD7CB|nr:MULTISPECIES: DUF4129 domain-containing protein [unclassified Microbacterium]MCR2793780.1 DUF4129 domain-containing protein [Microbacterium sp. zg.Y625]WIM26121.1 DUF4129 domain-containing protein [Microbacterium sp. zg-Y625]
MGEALTAEVPLIPDGDEARRWAETELSDPAYAITEPTALDRFAYGVEQFFRDLFATELPEGWGPWLAIGVSVLIVALVVVALAIWGMPRTPARSRTAADLFGETEQRTAAQLRAAAAQHADRGEWDAAVAERFRALARALDERGVVDVAPGATVHAFARDAGAALPALAERLERAASAFDDVRYLRLPGTPELYGAVAAVDDDAAASVPHRRDPVAAP